MDCRFLGDDKIMNLGQYITQLSSEGRYCFSSREVQKTLVGSENAIKLSLGRMRQKGNIATPIRGFHLIVPPEYRSLQCLPPEQFIDGLMEYLSTGYYIGLLSAAQFYGAAHQRPQIFQVVVPKYYANISCGRVKINFIFNKLAFEMPTQDFNTPTSVVKVSSPEVTAIDLVRVPGHGGGLSNVTTVLSELAENIDPQKLSQFVDLAITTPIFQRLGYLFSLIGEDNIANDLENALKQRVTRVVPLDLHSQMEVMSVDKRWNLAINLKVEPDI